jgi:hypothetical protein
MRHLSSALLYSRPLALPTKIRLGWKGFSETNTLDYYKNPEITAVKGFKVQAAGAVSSDLLNVVLPSSSPPTRRDTTSVTQRFFIDAIKSSLCLAHVP